MKEELKKLKHWDSFTYKWVKWKICIQPSWKVYFVHNYEMLEDEFENPIDNFWFEFATILLPPKVFQ